MTIDLDGSILPRRMSVVCGVVVAVAAMLAPTAAPAFTFEDGSGKWAPKFDVEEQARQFSTPDATGSTAGKQSFDTPIGTMQFSVRRGAPGYGSAFDPAFDSQVRAQQDRRYLDQMFTPVPGPYDGR